MRSPWLDGSVLRAFHEDGYIRGLLGDVLLAGDLRRRACAWAVVAAEVALGPALLWGRTRFVALMGACLMHSVFELAVHPDVYSWVMGALLLAFWP